MKQLITLLLSIICITSNSQTLKTFNGPFDDGHDQKGNATYTYYEDPETHEYLKQGAFKYTYKGQGVAAGFDQTITGSFDKGLKSGTWTYVVTFVDFGSGNPYKTGSTTLISHYKEGFADGNWKFTYSFKTRKKQIYNGQIKWSEYEPLINTAINMNFKAGKIVGAVAINDDIKNFKAVGNYDDNSMSIGTWTINDMQSSKNSELIFKDNLLYETIVRNNNGAILEGTEKHQKIYDDYLTAKTLSAKEREEAGLNIDTVCGYRCVSRNYISDYFELLFNNTFFLYKFIGGDLSYKEGIYGGCEIKLKTKKYASLTDNTDYIKAEKLWDSNEFLKAYQFYVKIDTTTIKPSERQKVTSKITAIEPEVFPIINKSHANKKYFEATLKNQNDSLSNDFTLITGAFKYKDIFDAKGKLLSFSNPPSRPWNQRDWVNAKLQYEKWNEDYITEQNSRFFEPYQIAYTEYYFKFKNVLANEEASIKESYYSMDFKNKSYNVWSYEKELFQKNIQLAKNEYELAKSEIENDKIIKDKNKQIEVLNNDNKKTTLFNKYLILYNDLVSKNQIYVDLKSYSEKNKTLSTIVDKVISLYSQDTKELEKKLKEVETADQIKSIILAQ
jgi:hypothetical protein